MELVVLWLCLAAAIGIWADNRGRSGIGFFLLSAVLSPLLGLIVVLLSKDLVQEAHNEQLRREEHEKQVAALTAIAASVGANAHPASPTKTDVEPLHHKSPGDTGVAAPRAFSVADELEKLAALKMRGLLTQDEFDSQKVALLRGAS